jgi:hypothetical protein
LASAWLITVSGIRNAIPKRSVIAKATLFIQTSVHSQCGLHCIK